MRTKYIKQINRTKCDWRRNKMGTVLLSLCLPTNGVKEWVFPVLDSIYFQQVDNSLFEVIVTNNGDNEEFHEMMIEYSKNHENLIYRKTTAYMFDNQLEALKLAHGEYFKFINHRAIIVNNGLEYLIESIRDNMDKKPVMYFSNGVLKIESEVMRCSNFDEFICGLRRYASWTSGVGIWKSDYEKISKDTVFDKISPHSGILFSEKHKDLYLIHDRVFCEEINIDNSKKGTYDLYKAFAVEEFLITLKLYVEGDISVKTLKEVKADYKRFVCELYWFFSIRHKPCSYDLDGFNDAMGIYFNKKEIIFGAYLFGVKAMFRKIRSLIK